MIASVYKLFTRDAVWMRMSAEKAREKPLCPRCGEPYSWVERRRVRGRVYLLAAHVVDPGKRARRLCYLGPEDSYSVAHVTNSFIDLRGFGLDAKSDAFRRVEYLRQLLESVLDRGMYRDEGLYAEVLRMVRDVVDAYRARIERLLSGT